MTIDPDDLRERYARLTDEELLAIDRNDLTRIAQKLFDRELSRRDLPEASPYEGAEGADAAEPVPAFATEDESLDSSDKEFPVSVFSGWPTDSSDAAAACDALLAASIPCQIVEQHVEGEFVDGHLQYQVMVPSRLSLEATSVLDKEFFNPKLEIEWRNHLESLSDDQVRALNADALCAGFLDRAERLRKVYTEELARRRKRDR